MHLNTLDYEQWNGVTSAERWQDTDHEGWKGLRAMRAVKGENREFTKSSVKPLPLGMGI